MTGNVSFINSWNANSIKEIYTFNIKTLTKQDDFFENICEIYRLILTQHYGILHKVLDNTL